MPPDEVAARAAVDGRLESVKGIGPKTAQVVREALADEVPGYLQRLEAELRPRRRSRWAANGLRAALRGDCHLHSDWSDGGSPIDEMGRTAAELGHEWAVLTDHSPRLTVANGLSRRAAARASCEVVAELNERWAPFRLLTGIECDILDDGSLDQEDELLDQLDVVVVSVHSKLRMDADAMTRRMVAAVRNPLADVLGHCTGRLVTGRGRPESEFDADAVFAACAEAGTAVEINSRPERLDPPRRLLTPGRRGGRPVRHRHRRPRAGPARLADLRLRAGRGVRRPAGTGRHDLDDGGPAVLDPQPGDTGVTHGAPLPRPPARTNTRKPHSHVPRPRDRCPRRCASPTPSDIHAGGSAAVERPCPRCRVPRARRPGGFHT